METSMAAMAKLCAWS